MFSNSEEYHSLPQKVHRRQMLFKLCLFLKQQQADNTSESQLNMLKSNLNKFTTNFYHDMCDICMEVNGLSDKHLL